MSDPKRAGGPGLEFHARRIDPGPVGVVVSAGLTGAVTWLAVVVATLLPGLLAVSGGRPVAGFVTDALAAGAVAGCVVVAVGWWGARRTVTSGGGRDPGRDLERDLGPARRLVLGGGAVGAVVASIVTFLLAGSRIPGWWPHGAAAGSQMVLGLAAVVLVATGVGVWAGMMVMLGPIWARACAAALPVVCLQAAFDLLPEVSEPWLRGSWVQAVLVGCALGLSVQAGRLWTWAMWVPALALVWFAQSLVPGVPGAMQQVRAGADVLAAFPLEPLFILGEHLGLTLLDPSAHGPAAMWVLALVIGVAVAGWRLRESDG